MTGAVDPLALLENLPLAVALRESPWLYPAVEIVHIVGLVLLVGSAAMLDLRLLGLSKSIPVTALSRHTLPWSAGALILIVPSGLLLFTANAGDLIGSGVFLTKMTLLMSAACNALWFRVGPYQSVAGWDTGVPAPLAARLSAGLSLLLWLAVISCGRMLAYTT